MTLKQTDWIPEHLLPKEGMTEEALKLVFSALQKWLKEQNRDLKVYSIAETAELLKTKERTIKGHLFEKCDLRYLKVGREVRIRERDIEDFIENKLRPTVDDKDILFAGERKK